MDSFLSWLPDDMGFYYGYRFADPRRIDVREERRGWLLRKRWALYIAGEYLSHHSCSDHAERAAVAFLDANPITRGA